MSARPDPTPSTQPASDASMSLDQVDWDLILKATGSTPGGRTRRGAAPIDFDPAPRPATAPEDARRARANCWRRAARRVSPPSFGAGAKNLIHLECVVWTAPGGVVFESRILTVFARFLTS